MNCREFLLTSGPPSPAPARSSTTLLYKNRAVVLEKIRSDPQGFGDVWIRSAGLRAVNEFHVRPLGLSRRHMHPNPQKNEKW